MKAHVLNVKEKLGIFFWRNILMPSIASIGGKKIPNERVDEFNYGLKPSEKVDYIAPKQTLSNKSPIVHIHGGAWVAGSKGKFYSKPLLKFADSGYPVFSVDYPLAPENPHPTSFISILKALLWIKKTYPEFNKVHLIGDSAGGNLAMMIGIFISNPDYLKKLEFTEIEALPEIISVVDLFGVNDRISWIEDGFPSAKLFMKAYSGEQSLRKEFVPDIPITPMDVKTINKLPHTFIVGAGKDKLLRSSKIWFERISAEFDHIKFKEYEGADHGFFSFGKGSDELIEDMIIFFNDLDLLESS
jgi:acetyl esterase/lipase